MVTRVVRVVVGLHSGWSLMALMALREYARHRGCTLAAVQKAVKSGRVTVCFDAGGKMRIDSISADATWREKTDPAKQSLLYSAGPAPNTSSLSDDVSVGQGGGATVPPPATSGDEPSDDADDEATSKYRQGRADREEINVRRARIELAQLEGSVISLDQAKLVVATSFRTLRDAILNVPARIKDQCAGETDSFAIEALIESELTQVLSSFTPAVLPTDGDQEDDADAS